ncbi:Type III restriction-modification system restriction subunit (EC [uncultured Gammaproteobacteria bacterium]|jgi:type III restriction enzyme|nr:Type III restriction-modification system restriction subunit (EC 3.1.21.5) [uncultured Gammaproteobacteria bacterium]VVH59038.1 Type III restriction-modification system restriction subunit (EC [uncultured Gammaproteobacteria bacterium]VVM19395.1 Type III restriction-modification system restriction subunit (EC [uncultured Gammaproteobacteria bacterium]VVM27016.1 Type III restriction-modification system restriction subunit (EC [uncultured Gammaproteobacteria bacterium]
MHNAITNFSIGYQKVSNDIHPTKFTNEQGEPLAEIAASDVGVKGSEGSVSNNYLFNELFYDSELEKKNITTNLREVVVFTKIPKNSIKIPVAGGASYSPDFAYVLNYKDGQQKLHFIVETKDTDEGSLRNEERQKIAHAEHFFGEVIQIEFKTQFSTQKITDLIKEIHPRH